MENKKSLYKAIELARTCLVCPSQWEIKLEDRRMIYVRYRWGVLTATISEKSTDNIFDAVNGVSIFWEVITDDGYQGFMEDNKMIKIINKIDFKNVKIIESMDWYKKYPHISKASK